MTDEERAQLLALGFDPRRLDPESPDYDPDYGDDISPKLYDADGFRLDGLDYRSKTPGESFYIPQFADIARNACRDGATNVSLARLLNTWPGTIQRWRNRYPAFRAAMDEGRAAVDDTVEESMLKRARGYKQPIEKIFCQEGVVTRVQTYEYVPGDPRAQFNWLKNRRPNEWRDRHEVKHEGLGNLSPADTMSIKELARQLQFIQKRGEDTLDIDAQETREESRELVVIDVEPEPVED